MITSYMKLFGMEETLKKISHSTGLSGPQKLMVVKFLKDVQEEMEDFDTVRKSLVEQFTKDNVLDQEGFREAVNELLLEEVEISNSALPVEAIVELKLITPADIVSYEHFIEE